MDTLDLWVKEWFDERNRNTYFSGHVIVDYGMPSEKVFLLPFQYGYGSQSETAAIKTLQKQGFLPEDLGGSLSNYCYQNRIILRVFKKTHCPRIEVKRFGDNEGDVL